MLSYKRLFLIFHSFYYKYSAKCGNCCLHDIKHGKDHGIGLKKTMKVAKLHNIYVNILVRITLEVALPIPKLCEKIN